MMFNVKRLCEHVSRRRRPGRHRGPIFSTRPIGRMESLEERIVLTSYFVDSLGDDNSGVADGALSLREAVIAANTNAAFGDASAGMAAGDIIRFDAALVDQTIALTNGELAITDDLLINGSVINITIDGASTSRIFSVNSAEDVSFRDLTLVNGATAGNGAALLLAGGGTNVLNRVHITASVAGGDGGGAIANDGNSVVISNSTIQGNTASGASGSGGGILSNSGSVQVVDSTLAANVANRAGGGVEVVDGSFSLVRTTLGGPTAMDGNVAGPMGSASPGNGGGLHVTGMAGTEVFVVGGTVQNNQAALEGGGLWNQSGSTLSVRDGAVVSDNVASGDAADNGGGGIFNNGGTTRIASSIVRNNLADGTSGSGGGVFSTGGSLIVSNSNISANQANRAGGGIEIVDGLASLANSTLGGANPADGNIAGPMGTASPGNGGGLHVTGMAGASVLVIGGTVQNNQAALEGGGLWNQSGSSMSVRDGVVVSDNIASGAAADDGGGGIFNNGGTTRITSSSMLRNVANGTSGSGGGVFSTGGSLIVNDSILSANVANRAGGGIEIVDGTAMLRQTTLGGPEAADGNIAGPMGSASPGNGGGLHMTGAANTRVIGGTVQNNLAALEGGGLWNSASGTLSVRDGVVVSDNTASGAAADDGGGGVFNSGGTTRIAASTVHGNKADGTSGSGGGVFSIGGTLIVNNSTISANVANRAGGGIEIVDGIVSLKQITLGGGDAMDGNVAGPMGTASPGNGGGLHVTGTAGTGVILIGGTVQNNLAAREGGGLWNQSGSTLSVRDGAIISDNTAFGDAADDGGGGIFNNGGTTRIVDTTIHHNRADGTSGSGGGVFSIGGPLIISDSTISANVANRAGGGIEIVNGEASVTRTILGGVSSTDGNIAGPVGSASPGNGGGLHVSGTMGTRVSVNDAFVSNNTAANEGGGLWNQSGGTLTVRNGTVVADNLASGNGGGGIFNNGGTLNVFDSLVLNNDSLGAGGGILLDSGGTATVMNSSISFNTANLNGGGIFNSGLLDFETSNGSFNTANGQGGGIFTDLGGNTQLVDANLFGNVPDDQAP